MREMNKDPNYIIARSAGSHSKIDVWVLDINKRKLDVYQCKPDNYTGTGYEYLYIINGTMEAEFKLI